jgi:hypothetical protein
MNRREILDLPADVKKSDKVGSLRLRESYRLPTAAPGRRLPCRGPGAVARRVPVCGELELRRIAGTTGDFCRGVVGSVPSGSGQPIHFRSTPRQESEPSLACQTTRRSSSAPCGSVARAPRGGRATANAPCSAWSIPGAHEAGALGEAQRDLRLGRSVPALALAHGLRHGDAHRRVHSATTANGVVLRRAAPRLGSSPTSARTSICSRSPRLGCRARAGARAARASEASALSLEGVAAGDELAQSLAAIAAVELGENLELLLRPRRDLRNSRMHASCV